MASVTLILFGRCSQEPPTDMVNHSTSGPRYRRGSHLPDGRLLIHTYKKSVIHRYIVIYYPW
jgi:hypothetical protein